MSNATSMGLNVTVQGKMRHCNQNVNIYLRRNASFSPARPNVDETAHTSFSKMV